MCSTLYMLSYVFKKTAVIYKAQTRMKEKLMSLVVPKISQIVPIVCLCLSLSGTSRSWSIPSPSQELGCSSPWFGFLLDCKTVPKKLERVGHIQIGLKRTGMSQWLTQYFAVETKWSWDHWPSQASEHKDSPATTKEKDSEAVQNKLSHPSWSLAWCQWNCSDDLGGLGLSPPSLCARESIDK